MQLFIMTCGNPTPPGSKSPNTGQMLQTIIAVPNMECLSNFYVGALEPEGSGNYEDFFKGEWDTLGPCVIAVGGLQDVIRLITSKPHGVETMGKN